jgi:hypothetical protein
MVVGVNATPRPLYSRESASLPIDQEAGWAPASAWMVVEMRKCLSAPGFKHQIVQTVASRNSYGMGYILVEILRVEWMKGIINNTFFLF